MDQETNSVEQNSGEPKKKISKGKVIRSCILFLLLVGLIVGGYYYGTYVQYYQEHFYEGTLINGIDCSDLTEEEAAELLQKEINTYVLTAHERNNKTDTITAEQIHMTYENDGSLKDLFVTQQPLLWALRIYQDKTYEVPSGFTYDEDSLDFCFHAFYDVAASVPMKNAEMVKNEDGTYKIEPEVVGTQLEEDKAYEAIKECVEKQIDSIDLEEFYVNPTVFADDKKLVEETERLNIEFALTRANIYIQFGNEQLTIDEKLLKSWIIPDKVEKYKIDETKVREYVQNLYDTYNVGNEGKLFKTKNGRVLTLELFEEPGWNIDVDKTYESYLKAIYDGYNGVLGPVMTRLDEAGNETGNMYVEISIDEQTMWLIVDGEVVVETPIVSGGADTGGYDVSMDYLIADFNSRSTPTNGIWTIKKKESPHFMRGPQLSDGSYEYTLDVTYWLPFNGLIGIHDNYQRTEFGGKIYQTAGSHGCINTPYDAVETIFNTVEAGTMVIVYGMDEGEEVFAPKPAAETDTENEKKSSDEEVEETAALPENQAEEEA